MNKEELKSLLENALRTAKEKCEDLEESDRGIQNSIRSRCFVKSLRNELDESDYVKTKRKQLHKGGTIQVISAGTELSDGTRLTEFLHDISIIELRAVEVCTS